MIQRFSFVKHKLTGQRLLVVDTNVIVARVAVPIQGQPDMMTFETLEVHEQEVEPEGVEPEE